MQAVAITDPGEGKVYKIPFSSLTKARWFAVGPYTRHCKVVIESAKGFEYYEAGELIGKDTLTSR